MGHPPPHDTRFGDASIDTDIKSMIKTIAKLEEEMRDMGERMTKTDTPSVGEAAGVLQSFFVRR